MEKFAVDLDKVLDDFEFNEEQAVRHHFKEDLPAKKYQRPPFQRINLADADFSPSKQTSSPVISYITESPSHLEPTTNRCEDGGSNNVNEGLLIDTTETHPIPDLLGSDFHTDSVVSLNLPDLTETLVDATNNLDVVTDANESSENLINEIEPHNIAQHNEIIPINDDSSTQEIEPLAIEIDSSETSTSGLPSLDDIQILPANPDPDYDEHYVDYDEENAAIPILNADIDTITEEEEEDLVKEAMSGLDAVADGNNIPSESVNCVKFVDTEIDETELASLLDVLEESEKRLAEANVREDVQKERKEEEEEEDSVVHEVEEQLRASTSEEEEEEEEVQEEDVPQRPTSLELTSTEAAPAADTVINEDQDNKINEAALVTRNAQEPKLETPNVDSSSVDVLVTCNGTESPPPLSQEERRLGKVSPFWVPDEDALNCMQCGIKFTVIKRRHHCRACGRVLCSKCCGMRACLEYLNNQEQRVCELCFRTLTKVMMYEETDSEAESSPRRRPNPNNPMEYCSTVPPPLQASPSSSQPPPSVLVPVLKREGSSKNKETPKKVMFSDGIRPGGDLTCLDEQPTPPVQRGISSKRQPSRAGAVAVRNLPLIDPVSKSFVIDKRVPPICEINKGVKTYKDPLPHEELIQRLQATDLPPLMFAINSNLMVSVRIVKLDCCIGKMCWVMSTRGMTSVGQDEIIIVLQLLDEPNEPVPCEIFLQLQDIYMAADKGNWVREMGYWSVKESTFLDSRQHGGFLFVRPSYQCVVNLDRPPPPYLVAILIHRLELPWARQFPLRLMLRLGAEFRYYPCPLVSVRHREPVYYEIGQTIMNVLADFKSYLFTLPSVNGLRIHMEAQQTTILIPKNRYDQVVRALNNSNDAVLALAGTFSPQADAHLVCMQSSGDEITYSTQAINIHEKPRNVTGASFVVFHASLKSTAGVFGKFSIVEDGLMVEIRADTMLDLRARLRALRDWSVLCGVNNQENVQVVWCDDEKDCNRGVKSVIDGLPLDGVMSIRVSNSTDHVSGSRFIRWTEVFIIKCEDGATSAKIGDPLEMKRLSENIACATCTALTKAKLLDSLAVAGQTVIALRTTVTQDSVNYEAGSNGEKLSATYMNSLDNELIPVLHKATAGNSDACAVLELVFHILDQ